MNGQIRWIVARAFFAPLALVATAHAAPLFNVNFDATGNDADTVGATIVTSGKADTSYYLHPSSVQNSPKVRNETYDNNAFLGFGSGKFAVFQSPAHQSMTFAPVSTDQPTQGTYSFSFDYQRKDNTGTGSLYLYFITANNVGTSGSQYVSQLLISNADGSMQVLRRHGPDGAQTGQTVINYTLTAGVSYRIQGNLVMDGLNSTANYFVTSGNTTTRLDNGDTDKVLWDSAQSLFATRLYLPSPGTGELAMDNIQSNLNAIPEPTGAGMLLLGAIGAMNIRRKQK